jgi:hypothetical protein
MPTGGSEFVQIVAASRADGGGRIQWKFDPAKRYSLVSEEHYDGDDRMYIQATWAHERIAEDVWFPTRMIQEFRDVETNKVTLRHEFDVDMKRSKFNQPSAMPDEVFVIKTEAGMEITHHPGEARIDPAADIAIMLYSRAKETIPAKGVHVATSTPLAIIAEWEPRPPNSSLSRNLANAPLARTH